MFSNPKQRLEISLLWPLRRGAWDPSALPPQPGQEGETCRWTRSSGTETAFSSISLGSCQPVGGGSRGPPGPQPGIPVLPAPHLRLLPGLVLALVCCLFTPLTCLFLFSSSWLFFLFSFSSPFPFFSVPLWFSLLFFFLSLLSDSLIPSGSVSVFLTPFPTHPFSLPSLLSLDCLHMKGFSRSESLSSLRHTILSQTIAPHPPCLFFRPELG